MSTNTLKKASLAVGGPSSSGDEPPKKNPFQKTGTDLAYEMKDTETSSIIRVDVPGCPEDDLDYWVDGSNIHFFADEKDEPACQHPGRNYGGTMVFNPKTYNVENAKAKLANGVLWITVPKHAKKAH